MQKNHAKNIGVFDFFRYSLSMGIFLRLLFIVTLGAGSVQAKADYIETATNLFKSDKTHLSPFENFAHQINQKADSFFTSVKSFLFKELGTLEQEASSVINNSLLRMGIVLVLALLIFFLLRRITRSFMDRNPRLPETKQVILELLPWIIFWALSLFLCEAIKLPLVLRHGLTTCVTLLSISFAVRQVSSVIYHLRHHVLHKAFHRNFKKAAPAFVYYGVTALMALGVLLTLGIIGGFSLAWVVDPLMALNSSRSLLMIDVVWYFYLLCFGWLMLALQHYHIKLLKKKSRNLDSLTVSLDHFHGLGYASLLLSFASWIAVKAAWIDPMSHKLVFVFTLFLIAVLFLQSAIRIIHYVTDTVISWCLSQDTKLMLDYVQLLRVLGYGIYVFILTTIGAYALDWDFYFEKLINTGDYIAEKGLVLMVVLGTIIFAHKGLHKTTHRLISSQKQLKREHRFSSSFFTFLLLFHNIFPTLLWTPGIMLALLMLGVDSAYILGAFSFVFAALIFMGKNIFDDIIKGLSWISEDIIAVGDLVTINNTINGRVEHLTFQHVAIRDYAGSVHTVSFGNIKALAHHEWKYAYAVCEVAIHHDEDLDKVVDIMMKVAKAISKDPKFTQKIIAADMEVPGIESIKDYALIIKARIKAKPGSQYEIQREYYKKLIQSFKKSHIKLAYPKQEIHVIKE